MTTFYKYGDLLHKSLSSAIFRVVLVAYILFLVQIQDNVFPIYGYIFYIVFYMILYVILLLKRKPLLRTLNDFIFIFIILYMKDISSIYNFILILAPLINAPNHTGEKRSLILIYFLTLILFLLLYVVSAKTLTFEISYILIGISFLVVISYLELSRARLFSSVFLIYKDIDEVMRKRYNRTQIPEIYHLIIEKISSKINIDIKQITCFERKRNKFILKNSSSFVYQYDFDFKSLNKKLTLGKRPIVINDEKLISILTIAIRNFIFVIIVDEKPKKVSILKTLYILSLTPLIFEKIASIIEFDNNLGKEEYRRLKD